MSLKTKILTLLDPSISMEEMSINDVESSDTKTSEVNMIKPSMIVGNLFPFIKIQSQYFDHHHIEYLKIEENGFMPTITVRINDISGMFAVGSFPKENPVMCVYIKSKNESYKPIRNDYLITSITSIPAPTTAKAYGKGAQFIIYGTMYIPELMVKVCASYPQMSSYDSMFSIAKKLGLGFSTNEDSTDDKMTWIQPYSTYADMIRDDITLHAYKDEHSFYESFIDKYYNLNFININDMLSEEFDPDKVLINSAWFEDHLKNAIDQDNDKGTTLMLTNYAGAASSELYMTSYIPSSNIGSILSSTGIRKYVNYYDANISDDNDKKFIDHFVEPNDTIVPGKRLTNIESREYFGVDYGNNHDNYFYAKVHNSHNISEFYKTNLTVTMNSVNLKILRGMRLLIMVVGSISIDQFEKQELLNNAKQKDDVNTALSSNNMYIDRFMSGYYYVTSIKYEYEVHVSNQRQMYKTTLVLSKQKWDNAIDPKTATVPENASTV